MPLAAFVTIVLSHFFIHIIDPSFTDCRWFLNEYIPVRHHSFYRSGISIQRSDKIYGGWWNPLDLRFTAHQIPFVILSEKRTEYVIHIVI